MAKSLPARWQFSSLTHRLLAACVVASLLIYGASFVHMREVLRNAIEGWVSQIAQARVDAAAARLMQRLQAQPDIGQLAAELDADLRLRDLSTGLDLGWPVVHNIASGQWLIPPPDAAAWLPLLQAAPPGTALLRGPQGLLALATLPPGQWQIGLILSPDALAQLNHRYVLLMLGSMVKDMLLVLATVAVVSRRTTRDLRRLTVQTEVVAKGELDHELAGIRGVDEVGRLARSFAHMQAALRRQLERLRESTAAQQKLESELAIARQIQQSMLPRLGAGRPAGACAVAALLQPAHEVGGDFYDCFAIGDDQLCLLVGDVAGKGIPAALLMARTVALMRGLGQRHPSPGSMLAAANAELCVNNDECMFVTLCCVVLDLRSGHCRHASAGHDAPLLLRAGQLLPVPVETGPAAGLDEAARYPEQALQLRPGDLLLMSTDGITEAVDAGGSWFGAERLAQALGRSPCAHPAWVIREVQQAVVQFAGAAGQSDDITMLGLQFQPLPDPTTENPAVTDTLLINGLPTPPEALRPCLRALLLARHGPEALVADAELVAEEIVVNVRQHSGPPGAALIQLQADADATGITLGLEDDGRPFDPLSGIAPADLDADDAKRSAGGYGFHLVRQLCRSLHYERRNGRNCLRLRLESTPDPEEEPHDEP